MSLPLKNVYYASENFSLDGIHVPVTETNSLAVPGQIPGGLSLQAKVDVSGVNLKSIITWDREGTVPFHHEQEVGEKSLFVFPMSLRCSIGELWGNRTPILHPAVAAVDATQAGIDDAYLRAMQNVDLLVGGRREDSAGFIRTLVTRYSKITYNPVAFLSRAASLYTVLVIKELSSPGPTEATWDRFTAAPRRIGDINTFAAICNAQLKDPRDNIYIRVDDPTEVSLVQVMLALCHDVFPVDTPHGLRQLWPQMTRPGVIYSCPAALPALSTRITALDVEEAMERFCSLMDCHDLWKEALGLAQTLSSRPAGAGVLGGTHRVQVSLPPSDMRIGAIGPLLAGISAEGMRSTPVNMPNPKEFLYAGAVRGVYVTAAYYEAIMHVRESHPMLILTGTGNALKHRPLAQSATARSIMQKKASKIAADAGWDCYNDYVCSLMPGNHRNMAAELFRPEKTPWWTNIIGHMGKAAYHFLDTWAKPAVPSVVPTPRVWYTHAAIGKATNAQIASAVRWMNATVNYISVQLPAEIVNVPVAMGTINRFLPNLEPKVHLHDGGAATAILKFPRDAVSRHSLVTQLAHCHIGVLPYYDEDVGAGVDADSLFGDPEPSWYNPVVQGDTHVTEANVVITPAPTNLDKLPDAAVAVAREHPENWDEVAAVIGAGMIGRKAEAESLRLASTGRKSALTDTAAQTVGMINPKTFVQKSDDPTIGAKRARSLIAATEALLKVASSGEEMQRLTVLRNEAMNYVAAVSREVGPLTSWDLAKDDSEAAKALFKGNNKKANPIIADAPDDPEAPTETLEDFGQATFGQGSTTGVAAAADVAPPSGQMPVIGFAPPPPSHS